MPNFKKNPNAMGSPYKMKKTPYKHTGSASHPTGAIAAHKGHAKLDVVKTAKLNK